jgi:hypothetical protein
MPFDAWLRGPLRDVMEDTLDARVVASRGLLDAELVSDIGERFRRGQTGWAEPWLLMMLELWCREVLDTCGHPVTNNTRVQPNALGADGATSPAGASAGVAR